MGSLCKLIDAVFFLFFLIIAVAVPLIDGQTCLPLDIYPTFLIDLKQWYSSTYGDYLVLEKPYFFVGMVWLEIFFQWPLSLINLYGILANKSWFRTTCLIYGVSVFTSMGAIFGELVGSGRGSDKLMMIYSPFTVFAVLAMLRGLLPDCNKPGPSHGRRPALGRKKRA